MGKGCDDAAALGDVFARAELVKETEKVFWMTVLHSSMNKCVIFKQKLLALWFYFLVE
jgi:hypothetical protein